MSVLPATDRRLIRQLHLALLLLQVCLHTCFVLHRCDVYGLDQEYEGKERLGLRLGDEHELTFLQTPEVVCKTGVGPRWYLLM